MYVHVHCTYNSHNNQLMYKRIELSLSSTCYCNNYYIINFLINHYTCRSFPSTVHTCNI